MSDSPDFRRLHDEENAEFSTLLHDLDDSEWEVPSLCEGWRVRDVVGHVLDGNELRLATLPLRLARHGFSSDRSGRVASIARAEGRSTAALVADFDARDAWAGTCRVFPPAYVLLDRLVHQQDIRRALDRPRSVPTERTAPLLAILPRLGTVFRSKQRMRGLRFAATDVAWTHGDASAPIVRGPAEAILMSTLGRGQALADCDGAGVALLGDRAKPPIVR